MNRQIPFFEIRRKSLHVLLGLLFIFLSRIFEEKIILVLLLAAMVLGLVISMIARNSRLFIVSDLIYLFDRKEHSSSFPGRGAFFFTAGCFFTILLFPINVSSASITVLSLGDSIAPVVGKYYGKIKHPFNPKKVIEGTIAGIFFGTLGSILFMPLIPSFFASLISMVFEALEIKYLQIDDNFTIPLISGLVLYVLQ